MSALVDSLIGTYDVFNEKKWRVQDIEYRNQERQWRFDDLKRAQEWRKSDIRRQRVQEKIENERKQANNRSEQLSAVSELGALLGGFALVCLINVDIPQDIDEKLMFSYGCVSALTVRKKSSVDRCKNDNFLSLLYYENYRLFPW